MNLLSNHVRKIAVQIIIATIKAVIQQAWDRSKDDLGKFVRLLIPKIEDLNKGRGVFVDPKAKDELRKAIENVTNGKVKLDIKPTNGEHKLKVPELKEITDPDIKKILAP